MGFQQYYDDLTANIIKLASYPSVSEAEPGYPTGHNAVLCLREALSLLKSLGFHTYEDPEGYYGYAEIGSGPLFGILGHLDVVPARKEDGWERDPFVPVVEDGRIYGRGTQDDKGPVVAAAFAMKALLDEGAVLTHRVRFILGLAEETSWECIRHYTAKEEIPEMSFTPDSVFPLVYAEKGLLQVELTGTAPAKTPFYGGNSMNAVAAFARTAVRPEVERELEKLGYPYKIIGDEIEAAGRSAHAKNPWRGENAVYRLAQAIAQAGLGDRTTDFITECLCGKDRFEGFTSENPEDFSGPLSVNLGEMKTDETGTRIGLDLRIPVTFSKEETLRLVGEKAAEYGFAMKETDWLKSIYAPLDSRLATVLQKTYIQVTGDTESKPVISGGATYARAFDNCVAFGANFQNKPTTEHMPNEYVELENLHKALEIYYLALKELVTDAGGQE